MIQGMAVLFGSRVGAPMSALFDCPLTILTIRLINSFKIFVDRLTEFKYS
jgi:hypothetical protein